MRELKNPWTHLDGYNCFGCSPDNHSGVHMHFYEDGEEVVSVWKPQADFQGWFNTLHGGIQAVLLDEICAWAMFRKLHTTGVTAKMELKFLKPVSTLDKYLILRAKVVEERRNLVTIEATLENSEGVVCNRAKALYFTFSPDKAEEMHYAECEPMGKDLTLEEIVKSLH